jgi:hypothetical protein
VGGEGWKIRRSEDQWICKVGHFDFHGLTLLLFLHLVFVRGLPCHTTIEFFLPFFLLCSLLFFLFFYGPGYWHGRYNGFIGRSVPDPTPWVAPCGPQLGTCRMKTGKSMSQALYHFTTLPLRHAELINPCLAPKIPSPLFDPPAQSRLHVGTCCLSSDMCSDFIVWRAVSGQTADRCLSLDRCSIWRCSCVSRCLRGA